jgi:hypothetical protein
VRRCTADPAQVLARLQQTARWPRPLGPAPHTICAADSRRGLLNLAAMLGLPIRTPVRLTARSDARPGRVTLHVTAAATERVSATLRLTLARRVRGTWSTLATIPLRLRKSGSATLALMVRARARATLLPVLNAGTWRATIRLSPTPAHPASTTTASLDAYRRAFPG